MWLLKIGQITKLTSMLYYPPCLWLGLSIDFYPSGILTEMFKHFCISPIHVTYHVNLITLDFMAL
jgi:hypothetical protein